MLYDTQDIKKIILHFTNDEVYKAASDRQKRLFPQIKK